MFSLFCCRIPRTYSPASSEHRPPHVSHDDSPESVALSPFNVPHRRNDLANNGFEEAQALRDIFNTLSSVRGYQFAKAVHLPLKKDSCNPDVELTRCSPTRSANGRLGALGHAVRQRLSESRLSKESSRVNVTPKDTQHPLDPTGTGGISYRSTGLTDLLMSRTASEGGYDSDAKDIHTPDLKISSNPPSVSISSGYSDNSLPSSDTSPRNIGSKLTKLGRPHALEQRYPPPFATQGTVQDTKSSDSTTHGALGIKTDHATNKSQGAAYESATEDRIDNDHRGLSGTDAQEQARNSKLVKNETTKLVPSVSLPYSDHNSIHLADMGISKRLASRSLMPASSPGSTNIGSSAEEHGVVDQPPNVAHFTGSGPQSLFRSIDEPRYMSRQASAAGLISTSYVRSFPPSSAELPCRRSRCSSEADLPWHLTRQSDTTSRFPGFIMQEHNRRPSDPKTRRLFEVPQDEAKLHPKWRSMSSANSTKTGVESLYGTRDDANSNYVGEGELASSDAANLASYTLPEAIKNTNSLAMPDRRASGSFGPGPFGPGHASTGQSSTAEEAAWLRDSRDNESHSRQGSESAIVNDGKRLHPSQRMQRRPSISIESKFTEEGVDLSSDALRRFISPTEANERMSVVSTTATRDRKHEKMTEDSADAIRDREYERLSEVGPEILVRERRDRTDSATTSSTNEGWLSQGKRLGWGYDLVQWSNRQGPGLQVESAGPALRRETAANVWDRAFRKAKDEQILAKSNSSILNVPMWGNVTSRRKSRSSETSGRQHQTPSAVFMTNRSRSANDSNTFSLDDHQVLCVEARKPLPSFNPRSAGVENGVFTAASQQIEPRKRSVVDFGRNTLAGTSEDTDVSGQPREFLSWANFPSHTHNERCGSAGESDFVQVKDFAPPLLDSEKPSSWVSLTRHQNRSAFALGSNPGSWKLHTFGRKKKSKSMTFSKHSGSPKHKSPKKGSLWHWRNMYRSPSSNLRRLRTGRRGSTTLGRELDYPELEIPAGLGEITFHGLVTPTPASQLSNYQAKITEVSTEDDDTDDGPAALSRAKGSHEIRKMMKTAPDMPKLSNGLDGNGLDGNMFFKSHEGRVGDMAKSASNVSSIPTAIHNLGGDGRNSSWVSLTMSNGFGSGDFSLSNRSVHLLSDGGYAGPEMDGLAKQRQQRLASTEMRESTIDFRKALVEREQKSRDDLLKMAEGIEGE